MANWHDFEKDAAVYFERLHQVFAKLDLLTVEKQNEQLSAIAINYSCSELKFAYGRVRVSVRYRPAVCIASVCLHTGCMHRISLRMHTAGRMHSIGLKNLVLFTSLLT